MILDVLHNLHQFWLSWWPQLLTIIGLTALYQGLNIIQYLRSKRWERSEQGRRAMAIGQTHLQLKAESQGGRPYTGGQ